MTENKYHAVILAASRHGQINELAQNAGVSHKCIMPLAGKPLIEHVVQALGNSPEIKTMTVVIDDPNALDGLEQLQSLLKNGKLSVAVAGLTLFDSVMAALPNEANKFPALITTADNVLLTPEMVAHFCDEIEDTQADIALGMVKKEVLLAKYPDGQRRFHRFKDGEWSNCNLYSIRNFKAVVAAKAFQGGGQFAKSLYRVLKAFGIFNTIAYRFAWFTRDYAAKRIGARFGVSCVAIDMPFAEAPIDVDNERTKRIAGEILKARQVAENHNKAE